ncbi:hypothetical protein BP6252_02933 [Coleophoma cylindrospora]|uniref:Uncharacterized protein n=1 Tax=Coleophoma cylindrospora TaxID=1849047 RepID=A0A3D8S6X4_9HELO|nr:hypothetical protein BP6252_02933 [Coleophoma cylindrospora]
MSFTNTVLITGGTTGLGFQCALTIARAHPEFLIVITARTDSNSAAATINKTLRQKNVVFLPIDLSNIATVRSFVKDWETKKYPSICTLLLNAGLQFPEGLRKTVDGIEATFGINHVGNTLLFYLLLPHLAKNVRVVVTSSGTHDPAQKSGLPDAKYTTAEELAYPAPEAAQIDGRQRYATSKLCNILWVYALHRRFQAVEGTSMTVNAFDPGLMPGTGLAREYSAPMRFIWKNLMTRIIPLMRVLFHPNVHTPRESGETLAWLATNPNLEGASGGYYEGRKTIKSSVDSYNEKYQEDLWEWTVKFDAKSPEELSRFEKAN